MPGCSGCVAIADIQNGVSIDISGLSNFILSKSIFHVHNAPL